MDTNILQKENRFAKAAIQVILEKPGQLYNPLYLYGEETKRKGLVLNIVKESTKKGLKVVQKKAKNIEEGQPEADILILDELEQIEEDVEKQNQLVDRINERIDETKQMVFWANKSPEQLQLIDKLKSRLTCGLVVDID